MKPGVEVTRTAVFPQVVATAATAEATCGSVASPETTSTNRISGAGLKKCMPTQRSGCRRAAATAVIDNEEVLVASTQRSSTTASRPAKILRLISRDSTAASMTSAQPARSATSDAAV